MHVDFFKMFKNHISFDIIYKFVHFDFHFRTTLNVKSKQKSEQLFKYIIICHLNER